MDSTYVVVVLLHCNNPWHVIECDSAQTEVCIVRDHVDLLNK